MIEYPRICPVCRQELPERGNRRVYVPWKRGYRLVHAGACFDAIDSQGVLELNEKPKPRLREGWALHAVRIRRYRAELLREHVQPVDNPFERHSVTLGLIKAELEKALIGEVDVELAHQSREQRWEIHRLVLAHLREVSGPGRTELFA